MTDVAAEKAAKKKQRDLTLAAVLLAVFAFLLFMNFNKKKPAAAPAAMTKVPAAQSMSERLVFVTNLRVNDKLREEQEKVWEKEWARDPFVPKAAVGSLTKAVNLTLNGILWDERDPKAIVNEKTLLKGDTIYGYTVVQIKPRSVVMRTGEKNIELSVFKPVASDSP